MNNLQNNKYKSEIINGLSKKGLLLSDQDANQYKHSGTASRAAGNYGDDAPNASPAEQKHAKKWLKVRNGCLYNKIPEILGVSATGTLIDAMTTGSWQKAAKIILKLGGKGTVVGLAASLTWTYGECSRYANSKVK